MCVHASRRFAVSEVYVLHWAAPGVGYPCTGETWTETSVEGGGSERLKEGAPQQGDDDMMRGKFTVGSSSETQTESQPSVFTLSLSLSLCEQGQRSLFTGAKEALQRGVGLGTGRTAWCGVKKLRVVT